MNKRIMKVKASKLAWGFVIILSIGINLQLISQTQATVGVIESTGGCNLVTDCDNDFICVDLVLTIDQDKSIDSYNIWFTYNNLVLSRQSAGPNDNSGQGDNSCIIANANQDTDNEADLSAWRVAGVPGSPYPMIAGVSETIHTMCFDILDEGALNLTEVCAGGNQFFGIIKSTITFTDATFDDDIPVSCLTLDGNFTTCSLLPVEYLSFTAQKDNTASKLDWITTQEIDNDHFDVERSVNGIHFTKIGEVVGNGTVNTQSDYQFYDKAPYKGVNYYRLKQCDYDGDYEYSEIRSVEFTSNYDLLMQPNPTSGVFTVSLSGDSYRNDGQYEITILNLQGEIVRTFDYENNTEIDISGLTDGMYLVRVEQNGQLLTYERLIKSN